MYSDFEAAFFSGTLATTTGICASSVDILTGITASAIFTSGIKILRHYELYNAMHADEDACINATADGVTPRANSQTQSSQAT
jgi:hypothetical protein